MGQRARRVSRDCKVEIIILVRVAMAESESAVLQSDDQMLARYAAEC